MFTSLRNLAFAALVVLPPAVQAQQKAPPGDERGAKDRPLFDGQSLRGWRIADTFDFKSHGPVTVNGQRILLGKGSPATGVSYTGEFPRMNYQVTLEARRVDGSDFFCGLTFPVGEKSCTLILGGWGGGVVGLSNLDDLSAVDNETTQYLDFKQDRWYAVRLRVTPDKIEAWIDGDQIIDVKTTGRKLSIWWEQEPMKPLGVASWNTGSELRKIRVSEVGAR